jgi:hypothetical protein
MKKRNHYLLFAIVSISMVFGGCTKVTQTSLGDPIPIIKFVKASSTNIKQFEDSLAVTFTYEDGDGDLGFQNADINSLEVKDSRLINPDMYYVTPRAPVDSKVHISGELTLKMKNLFLIGSGSIEKTTLQLRIQDRAGHWSNIIFTPEITITK